MKQQNVREVSKHRIFFFYATLGILLTALPGPRLEYRLQTGASVTRGRGLNLPKVLNLPSQKEYFVILFGNIPTGGQEREHPLSLGWAHLQNERRSQSSSVLVRLMPVSVHRCMCVYARV